MTCCTHDCHQGRACPARNNEQLADELADEILAHISRDVARQLAELQPRPRRRWVDELGYWGRVAAIAAVLYFAVCLVGVLVPQA